MNPRIIPQIASVEVVQMEDFQRSVLFIPANASCLLGDTDIFKQGLQEVEKQLTVLGLKGMAGITLKELDKRSHGQDEFVLNGYLHWLHYQLDHWDLSQPTVYHPQIQSWCDRLRSHGVEDQRIYNAFDHWRSAHTRVDPTSARRYLVIEEKLRLYLSIQNHTHAESRSLVRDNHSIENDNFQKSHHPITICAADSSRNQRATMKRHSAIEVSPSKVVSDVEFSEYGEHEHNVNYGSMKDKVKVRSQPLVTRQKSWVRPESHEDGHNGSSEERITEKDGGKNQEPWKGYVCKRCYNPGHHLTDCPTNLDPSYDTKPVGRYRCDICGAVGEHYGTLCPKNIAPWSLNQLRLNAGIITMDIQHSSDKYCPSYDNPLTAVQRDDRSEGTEDGYIQGDRLALMEVDHDAGYNHEPRRALAKRPHSREQTPEDDRKSSHGRNSRCNLPPSKRPRREGQQLESARDHSGSCGQNWSPDSRRGPYNRDHSVTPREFRPYGHNREGSYELLTSLNRCGHHTNGRLSYWDDEYESPKPLFSVSSEYRTDKRMIASELRSNDIRENEIKDRFPNVDTTWIDEMLNFDVDEFFNHMNECVTTN